MAETDFLVFFALGAFFAFFVVLFAEGAGACANETLVIASAMVKPSRAETIFFIICLSLFLEASLICALLI